MPPENAPVLYTDDGARFGGREYPGCFSINEVRQRLGQPLLEPVDASAQQACPDVQGEMVTAESHFLPNCACAALHATCGPSHDEAIELEDVEISLKQLRESSEAGCWFCAVIYGGIMAAPPWDPESKVKRPSIRETIGFYVSPDYRTSDLSISVFTHLDDPQMIEPALLFYVDEDEGKASTIVAIMTGGLLGYQLQNPLVNYSAAESHCLPTLIHNSTSSKAIYKIVSSIIRIHAHLRPLSLCRRAYFISQ
ncbi:hypothetical protein J3F84DRAFT_406747 [Trichoderma pleuroticola]